MPIEGETVYRSLGVSIDENLSWIGYVGPYSSVYDYVGLCSIELRRLTNVKPLYDGYTTYLRYFDVAPLTKKPEDSWYEIAFVLNEDLLQSHKSKLSVLMPSIQLEGS